MKLRTQFFLIFSAIIIFAILTVGYFYYKRIERLQFNQLRDTLVADAQAAALLIDGDTHKKIVSLAEPESPEFIRVRDVMRKYRDTDPRISEIYTMVKTDNPKIYKFIIDAAEVEDEDGDGVISEEEAPAGLGEDYDISPFPEMAKAFDGATADREINRDKWGWWLSGYAPIIDSAGKAVGIVGIDISADTIREEQARLRWMLLLICLPFIPLALLVAHVFSYTLTRPIYRLVRAAREIGKGNYDHRTGMASKNEIGFLASTMDSMAENIRRSFDKLTTLNRTANILASNLDLEQALKISLNLVLEVTRSSRGIIILLGRAGKRIENVMGDGLGELRRDGDDYLVGNRRLTVALRKDRGAQITAWLEASGCTRCFPLVIQEEARGYFLLDPEIKDEEFLDTLMAQVSLVIQNARLFHEAITDGLTGLFLKRYFQIQLDTEVKRSQRHGTPLCMMMLDLDDFKKINDTYGHPFGDAILKEAAAVIRESVREIDIPSRYGGEEIAVILPETALDDAVRVGERLRTVIREHAFGPTDRAVRLTASIGIASMQGEEDLTSEKLTEEADTALYLTKQRGKDGVTVFDRESKGKD